MNKNMYMWFYKYFMTGTSIREINDFSHTRAIILAEYFGGAFVFSMNVSIMPFALHISIFF